MVLSCHLYSSSFFLTLPYVVNLITSSTFLSLFIFFHTLYVLPPLLISSHPPEPLCLSLPSFSFASFKSSVSGPFPSSFIVYILFFLLHYFCHSCITLISIPFFSSSSFPSLHTFFSLTSFDVWRRVGIHSADKERGDDVTADVIHQHLLWSKNTHHRAHTVSLQLHSAFVSTSTHYWDGPAFTQLGLMGMQGYMLLDQNWHPWCVKI